MKKNLPISIRTLLLTTVTILAWVFFSIYWAIKKPLPVVISPEITNPVNPDINLEVVDKIKGRVYFEEGSFEEIKPIQTETPTNITETENNTTNTNNQIEEETTPEEEGLSE